VFICASSMGGTPPARYAFQAAVISASVSSTSSQFSDPAASKIVPAPSERASSASGVGPASASVGIASATASRSPPEPVENSP
jgi:hypothetical protein